MNPAPLLLLSLGLAAGASVATTYALRPASSAAKQEATSPDELAFLRAEVERLGKQLESLQGSPASTSLPAASSERVDQGAIERAVARYMDEHTASGLPSLASVSVDEAAATFDYKDALAQLNLGDLDEAERVALWKQIREAGKLDEAIAWLELNADENSNDPDAQVEVASAYIQKIFEVGDGPEAGLWAGKADSAYDRALELDSEHWDARFNKAISLSFWPPIFGKQSEAIGNFETLIGQQQNGAPEQRFAQTYVLLGNLYTQTGQLDKAGAIWNQGLALFPDDESLNDKLGTGQ